ncbi:hypothetical protein HPB47_019325 [Ixodes persulcatus]|uniref:Uncharacterized protein n=1 Tax=Ixodes persulcatus TaxID=34615 RepID=A0AC60QIP9_IXOPE|nr:hypothetical protein HPB47_019325 [Ixodes persulcatus]
MTSWNVVGAVHRPKGMTLNSYRPSGVTKAVFSRSHSSTLICQLPSRTTSPQVAASVTTGTTTLDRGGRFTWAAATRTAADAVWGFSEGGTGLRSVNLFSPRSMTAPYSHRKSMPRMTSLEQSCRTTNFTGHAELAVGAPSVNVVSFPAVKAHRTSVIRAPHVGLSRSALFLARSVLRRRDFSSGCSWVLPGDRRLRTTNNCGVGHSWWFRCGVGENVWLERLLDLFSNNLGNRE